MVLVPAPLGADPRQVVTPLIPSRIKELLQMLGILEPWRHIPAGLRSGFSVGVSQPLLRSYLFRKSRFFKSKRRIYRRLHCRRMCRGPLFSCIHASRTRVNNWPIHNISSGLVPKPNSSKLRLIQDLSYPQNNPKVTSVNSMICADDFPTAWGTFSSTADLILSLPPGCRAATFDISAAYRITPVRPDQQNYTCIRWRDKVYVDRAVCFGLASSAGVFGAVADMLVAIYTASGYRALTKWVDDFFVVAFPSDTWSEEDFVALTTQLGVPWSLEKTRKLAPVQRFTGFDWDLRNRTVALPQEKLNAVIALIARWAAPEARFTAVDAASLHGKLVHISSVFVCIRPFLRSASRFAATMASRTYRAARAPPTDLIADLSWIRFCLQSSPNVLPLRPRVPLDLGWWGDASSSFGIGVVIQGLWAVWKYAPGFTVGPNQPFDIGWAEAVAVELALRLALHHDVISSATHAGTLLLVRSDNQGVVTVVNKGRSRSSNTNRVLKEVGLERLCSVSTSTPNLVSFSCGHRCTACFLAFSFHFRPSTYQAGRMSLTRCRAAIFQVSCVVFPRRLCGRSCRCRCICRTN